VTVSALTSPGLALVRYNADGTLDATFDDDGIVITPVAAGEGAAQTLVQQPDGMLITAGLNVAARYLSTGAQDTGGIAQVLFDPLQTAGGVSALAVQGDGKLVAAGDVTIGGRSSDMAVARFDYANGLDPTFGSDTPVLGRRPPQPGHISAGSPLDEDVTAVALQDDGGIVLAGQIGTEANADFLLARFNPDGTTDRSCALFGYNVLDFGHGRDRGKPSRSTPTTGSTWADP